MLEPRMKALGVVQRGARPTLACAIHPHCKLRNDFPFRRGQRRAVVGVRKRGVLAHGAQPKHPRDHSPVRLRQHVLQLNVLPVVEHLEIFAILCAQPLLGLVGGGRLSLLRTRFFRRHGWLVGLQLLAGKGKG